MLRRIRIVCGTLGQGRRPTIALVTALLSSALLLGTMAPATAWLPLPADYLVDRVVLHCPASEQAGTITAKELCSLAQAAIERLSRGEINAAILELVGWQHANDPGYSNECERRRLAPIAGMCDPIFFRVFKAPVRFPVLTVERLSQELLQDNHVLVLRLRTTMAEPAQCPAGKSALRLETSRLEEGPSPQDRKDAWPRRSFDAQLRAPGTEVFCFGHQTAAHDENIDQMMVVYAKYFHTFPINMMNRNRYNKVMGDHLRSRQ